jgi:hypothetical protein
MNTSRDRLVTAGLRLAARRAPDAPRPPVIDMRRLAPFPWVRWYVFDGATRAHMRRTIRHELGFAWNDAPQAAPPLESATSLLVFASRERVLSTVSETRIAMGCLNDGHGRTRARSRFGIYRSAGAPADQASGLPASPPSLVALASTPGTNPREQRCVKGFGVLH